MNTTPAHLPANDSEAALLRKAARQAKWHAAIAKLSGYLDVLGLSWIVPLLKMGAGDPAQPQLKELWRLAGIPVLAMLIFLTLWARLAPTVETSLGAIPGPAEVWEQTGVLWEDHKAERAKEAAFLERQEKRNAKKLERNPNAKVKIRPYTGKPTYIDQ
ncbi:MAG: ABC transporter permease, partial [Pseudomonadota bacterium]